MSQIKFDMILKQLMKDEEVSKRALSIGTNIDRRSITSYLQGVTLPRYDALAKISDYFEVSADALLGLEDFDYKSHHTQVEIKDIPIVFVARLSELMQNKSYSQNKLAQEINMQQASVSKWLRMKTMPEAEALAELARVLHSKVDFLIGRE